MEFNFNVFFGYENQINSMENKFVLALFAILMYSQVVLLLITGYLRKFKIYLFRKQLNILILTLGLTTFFGTFLVFLLYYIATDCTKVKILYCWISILISMFCFSIFNYNKVRKLVKNNQHQY